jgi:hypothetical protein
VGMPKWKTKMAMSRLKKWGCPVKPIKNGKSKKYDEKILKDTMEVILSL